MDINELKELQSRIIKKNKKCNFIAILLVIVIIIISIIINMINKYDMPILGIAIFLEFVVALTTVYIVFLIKDYINKEDILVFYKNYKNIFVLSALQNCFDNITYNQNKGFEKEYIDKIGMLNTGDRYYSNDLISGTYKNINFEQSDIHIEEKHESKDRDGNTETTWVIIFRGKYMVFDFNKTFKANIQIIGNGFDASSLPWEKIFSRVELEDENFNKKFCVYSEDEHEAFYILTPHFMEKLKRLEEKINGGIMFGFVDNKLHVAIDNFIDSFEYNVYQPINEHEIKKDVMEELNVITDFVDYLDLENDLFK